MMIYPNTVVVNIMACRVFRNLKLGRHSQIFMPTIEIDTGNLAQHDYIPGIGGENLYRMGGRVNMPTSAEVSRWKELSKLPIEDSDALGIEKPNIHIDKSWIEMSSGFKKGAVCNKKTYMRRTCIWLTPVLSPSLKIYFRKTWSATFGHALIL